MDPHHIRCGGIAGAHAAGDLNAAVEDVKALAQFGQRSVLRRLGAVQGTFKLQVFDFQLRIHPFGIVAPGGVEGLDAVPHAEAQPPRKGKGKGQNKTEGQD